MKRGEELCERLVAAGIPVVIATRKAERIHIIGLPVVVSGMLPDGSRARISVARLGGIAPALARFKGGEPVIERYAPGREVACGAATFARAARAFAPVEVIPGSARENAAWSLPFGAWERVQELAARAHAAVGARGWSLVRFVVHGAEVRVAGVDCRPSLAPHSLFARSAEAAGLSIRDIQEMMHWS
jgi:D-alanine-D-alanine ligase-like ATP-grasp enzyme